jgi:hypothetical protein
MVKTVILIDSIQLLRILRRAEEGKLTFQTRFWHPE